MNGSMARDIEAWEDEGGAAPAPPGVSATPMSGTASHVEWAQRIKRQVNPKFDRGGVIPIDCGRQGGDKRTDPEAVIAILEDKRTEVMSREQAQL